LARFDLDLSDAEFGRLTLEQFDGLLERKREQDKLAFLQAGIVAASIYNANPFRGQGAKAVDPLDFVPGYQKQTRQQTVAEQVQALTRIMGCGPKKH